MDFPVSRCGIEVAGPITIDRPGYVFDKHGEALVVVHGDMVLRSAPLSIHGENGIDARATRSLFREPRVLHRELEVTYPVQLGLVQVEGDLALVQRHADELLAVLRVFGDGRMFVPVPRPDEPGQHGVFDLSATDLSKRPVNASDGE